MKRRMILIIFGILFLSTIIMQEPISFVVSAQSNERTYPVDPDIDCIHLFSDTNFTEEPTHGINGTSGEFSTNFGTDSSNEVFNYVELKWEHSPGGSIQIRDDLSYGDHEPASWDYAYYSQIIEWPYETLPMSCLSLLEFEVECTGDFMNEFLGENVYQVYVMLIDSRGNFARLHSEKFLSDVPYQYYTSQLSSEIIEYGWGGIVENESGYQEAPSDNAELRIILAPSANFFGTLISNHYGTVTIRCKFNDLQVLADIPPLSTPVEPIAFGSVNTNTSTNYVGMATSPNGSILTLGRTFGMPDCGVIVSWDEEANPVWIKEWNDAAAGAITATNDLIYTVGHQNEDVSLAVWSHEGELKEELHYNLDYIDFGKAICVLDTGEIFIFGFSYNSYFGGVTLYLLKLNSDYSVDWKIPLSETEFQEKYQLDVTNDGVSYLHYGDRFHLVSPDGSIARSSLAYNAESFLVTSDNYLWCSGIGLEYTEPTNTARSNLKITRLDFPSIENSLVSNIEFKYSSVFFDSSLHSSIAIDNDEQSIYTLSLKGVNFMQSIIVKLTQDGSVTWCKSIQNSRGTILQDDWNYWYELCVLENDKICVAGSDYPGGNTNLTLAIFDFKELSLFETIDWILIGCIAGAVVIADVVIIYYMKCKKQPIQEEVPDIQKAIDELLENSDC